MAVCLSFFLAYIDNVDNFVDQAMDRLGKVMFDSYFTAYIALDPKLVAYGLTDDVLNGWVQESSDPDRNVETGMYYACARKV
jgi:hypothetical protein